MEQVAATQQVFHGPLERLVGSNVEPADSMEREGGGQKRIIT